MGDGWHPIEDNLSTRFGPKPHLRVIELPPWIGWKTTSESARATRWIETYLPITTGHRAGEPMKLASFQRKIVRTIYDSLGTFVSIPAANGKSTLLAALAVERLCRGDAYVEVDVMATKREQAGIIVDAARRFVNANPELAERCIWYASQGVLEFKPTGSRLKAHPARLSSLQGLDFSLCVIDEIGFADDALVAALVARLAKRPDARLIGIGTPSYEPNTLHRIRTEAEDGALPKGVSYLEWSAPPGAEIEDRRTWRQANPALAAGFLNADALAVQAHLMPERAFRTYCLGQWVDEASSWIPDGLWEACPLAEIPYDGSEVVLAVEGTYKRSLAIVGAGLDGSVFHVYTASPASDDMLERVLAECCERWEVLEVSHPKRIRSHLFAKLAGQGLPLRPWEGNADVEAASANELHRAIIEGRISHDHDELVAQHMRALSVRTVLDGSLRLVRPDTGDDVDAALAVRAAWWRAWQLAEDASSRGPLRIY
jgi:phage terminase large subunit-like protein